MDEEKKLHQYMKICESHNRQKGHNDSGVLLCIVSKNDRGNNNYDEEDYMEYVKKTFHSSLVCVYLQFGNIILACMIVH